MTISTSQDLPASTPAQQRLTFYCAALVTLCLLVATTEGYDAVAMSLAAPLLSKSWEITHKMTGVLLTVSVAGMMAGSFLLAPLGDRFGRRPTILLSLTVAGLGTLAGAFADSYEVMLATRIVAGIGLGSAIPNVLAIAMEVVPNRFRTYTVVLVGCGYPLGAAVGSALVMPLAVEQGHHMIFAVGGIATLAAALACAAFLPESPSYMRHKPRFAGRLATLTSRLGLQSAAPPAQPGAAAAPQGSPVKALFSKDYFSITVLIWTIGFANMAIVFFFLSWLPSLLVAKGLDLSVAIKANAMFNGAGILGGLILAMAVSRWTSTWVFAICFGVAGASVLTFAFQSGGPIFWLMIVLSGACVVGSQFCFTAVANQFYPAMMRATGAGYASGAGRLGAIAAPLLGGWVMQNSGSVELTFAVAAIPAAIGLAAVILLQTATNFSARYRQRSVD